MLAGIVLLQDLCFSAFAVSERKNDILAKAEIVSVVETRYRTDGGDDLRLFFLFGSWSSALILIIVMMKMGAAGWLAPISSRNPV
jgi:hypothetical protein